MSKRTVVVMRLRGGYVIRGGYIKTHPVTGHSEDFHLSDELIPDGSASELVLRLLERLGCHDAELGDIRAALKECGLP